MPLNTEQPTIREITGTLWKRRKSLAAIFMLTMLIAGGYIFIVRDDLYMVSARILVKLGREQAPPATVLGSGPQVIGYRSGEVNTETEIFQSRQLYEQLVTELKLDQPGKPAPPPSGIFKRLRYEAKVISAAIGEWKDELLIRAGLRPRLTEREKVIAQLQKNVKVEAATDSNVFVAIFATPFREGGAMVLNHHIDNYLKFRQQLYRESSSNLFSDEVKRVSAALSGAERELQGLEERYQISAYDKQKEILIERLAIAESAEKDSAIYASDIEEKVRRFEKAAASAKPNYGGIGDFPRESLQHNLLVQLAELDREREAMRLKELDTSDRIRNNRDQFRVIAATLEASLRSLLEERKAQHEARAMEAGRLRRESESLHEAQIRWKDLKRKITDLENHHLFYSKKLEETRAGESMTQLDIGNVAVIERAADAIQPVGIRKTVLLEISAGVAILLGLAWVTILEFFDTRIGSPEALSKCLGGPVLAVEGEIPRVRRARSGGVGVADVTY
jgi:uncharacterized protein involved in exopolysaccharide biosynthesis